MPQFFECVYRLVEQIPPGRVTSYGALAAMLGRPRAARTVGWALHSLPASREVPWHRVINSQGRVSSRQEGHAADLQRALLEDEGVVFDEENRVDWSQFGWAGLPPDQIERLLQGEPDPAV